jgi:HAD superfamily hydrolase (TIGR01509 family)
VRDPAAVIFDFDGLVMDTEWPIYELSAATFAEWGVDLLLDDWVHTVGLADDEDWFRGMCLRSGVEIDPAEFERRYRARDRSFRDRLPPLAGVVELIADVVAHGVPIAIASSSTSNWVTGHLERVGLLEHFGAVRGFDHTGVGKPAPDVYLAACEALAVAPATAIALEDSAHGVTAAKAAGLRCIAVPNRITRLSNFDHADAVIDGGLAGMTLAGLVALLSTR